MSCMLNEAMKKDADLIGWATDNSHKKKVATWERDRRERLEGMRPSYWFYHRDPQPCSRGGRMERDRY